jgi:hypothetical protein
MKILDVNHKVGEGGDVWWGTAIDGADKIKWFYETSGHHLTFRREQPNMPGYSLNIESTAAAKEAVTRDIRAKSH